MIKKVMLKDTVDCEFTTTEDVAEAVSMTETNCAKWRRESVPAGLREKGCEAPAFIFMLWY